MTSDEYFVDESRGWTWSCQYNSLIYVDELYIIQTRKWYKKIPVRVRCWFYVRVLFAKLTHLIK